MPGLRVGREAPAIIETAQLAQEPHHLVRDRQRRRRATFRAVQPDRFLGEIDFWPCQLRKVRSPNARQRGDKEEIATDIIAERHYLTIPLGEAINARARPLRERVDTTRRVAH